MAATSTRIAPDSSKQLHDLIGDDATATFENDPKFIGSNPTESASSANIVLRDTDDTEDSSEEEEDELAEDDEYDDAEDEDDEDEEEDDDDDDEEEDDDDL